MMKEVRVCNWKKSTGFGSRYGPNLTDDRRRDPRFPRSSQREEEHDQPSRQAWSVEAATSCLVCSFWWNTKALLSRRLLMVMPIAPRTSDEMYMYRNIRLKPPDVCEKVTWGARRKLLCLASGDPGSGNWATDRRKSWQACARRFRGCGKWRKLGNIPGIGEFFILVEARNGTEIGSESQRHKDKRT